MGGGSSAVGSVPVSTIYGDEKSKINPVVDTLRFFRMLRRYKQAKRKKEALHDKQ